MKTIWPALDSSVRPMSYILANMHCNTSTVQRYHVHTRAEQRRKADITCTQ